MGLGTATSRLAVLGTGPRGTERLPVDEKPWVLQQGFCPWPLFWILLKALREKVLQCHTKSIKDQVFIQVLTGNSSRQKASCGQHDGYRLTELLQLQTEY